MHIKRRAVLSSLLGIHQLDQKVVVRFLDSVQFVDTLHELQPLGNLLVQLLQSEPIPTLHHLLSAHPHPREIPRQHVESHVAQTLQVVFASLGGQFQLTGGAKVSTSVGAVAELHMVALGVNVPLDVLEVQDHQFVLDIEHEMLGTHVSVEVPTVVKELEDFDGVGEDSVGRKLVHTSNVLVKDQEADIGLPVLVDPVHAHPPGLNNLLPEFPVHIQLPLKAPSGVLNEHRTRVLLHIPRIVGRRS